MDKNDFSLKRRDFLKTLIYGLPTIAAKDLIVPATEAKLSTSKRLNGAVLGSGYIVRKLHIHSLMRNPRVNLKYICDVDDSQLNLARQILIKNGVHQEVKYINNYEELIQDKTLDFVLVALPHHWLAKAAVELIKAKKHLYLEKPCCLTLEEYLELESVYQRSSVLVQVGTQNRSNPSHIEGVELLKKGLIGERISGLCLTNQSKSDRITPAAGKPNIPKGINLEKWFGPTKTRPMIRKHFHEDWARFWDLGHGIGDRNVHRLDMMNWAMGFQKVSDSVQNYAGLFPSRKGDCGTTPNTSFSLHRNGDFHYTNEYKIWHKQEQFGLRRGLVIEGKKGYFAMGNLSRSFQLDLNGKIVKQFGPKNIFPNHFLHFDNFIDSLILRNREKLNNDLLSFLPSSGNSILENVSVLKGTKVSLTEFEKALKHEKEILLPKDYISTLTKESSTNIQVIKGRLLKDININKMVTDAKTTDFPIRKEYPKKYQL